MPDLFPGDGRAGTDTGSEESQLVKFMYTDLLVKIKNGQAAKKEVIKTRYSVLDMAVAEILAKYHYVESAAKKGRLPKRFIEIKLNGSLSDFSFKSKSSRRLYIGYRDLKPVKQGYGLAVLSTPKGVLSDTEARREKVGGELLFEVW